LQQQQQSAKCCLFSSVGQKRENQRSGEKGRNKGERGTEGKRVCIWVTKSTAMLNCLIEFTADALKLAVI